VPERAADEPAGPSRSVDLKRVTSPITVLHFTLLMAELRRIGNTTQQIFNDHLI